ncbi:MAG: DNA gyrase inhibitor YacG [Caulobacteraceae bacterium]
MKRPAQARKCPICGKPEAPDFRPFCSRRCGQVDLQRWFSGAYAVPAADEDDPDRRPGSRAGDPGTDGEDEA